MTNSPTDFTFHMYESLLRAGLEAGYEHLTVRKYFDLASLPDRVIIHRHDVDRKPENALEMAKLEAAYGISSTYYFRTIDKTFQPALIREIESLGHEVGYHYEDMDRARGDIEMAHDSFEVELTKLRAHATVDTVCMHGNPLTRHDNRDMWTDSAPSLEEYGLLGEAYLTMPFDEISYFSDTGRTWRDGRYKCKDVTTGPDTKRYQADKTSDLIALLESGQVPAACLLSHPNRWARSSSELVLEATKDAVTNLGKIGLNTFT